MIYLVEEKSMTGPKPAMLFAKWKDEETIAKTQNLLQVLENLGRPGENIMSTLAVLNGTRTFEDVSSLVEKAKNE